MPTPLPNYTVHKCDHCGKKYFRKGDATRHEKYCPNNPNNNHKCFQQCKFLERGEEEVDYRDGSDGYLRKNKTFHCSLLNKKLYSFVAERRKHDVIYEKGAERMPLECDKYQEKTFEDEFGFE